MSHLTVARRCLVIAAIGVLGLSAVASAQLASSLPFPLEDHELEVQTTSAGVAFVRTPDEFFQGLPEWPYEPKYVEIDGLRQGYVDEGPADGEVVLLLHGQPSWSYLYRKMIPVFVDAGYRVIAMDHLGMGRSDKPIDLDYYTYQGHVDRLYAFIVELDLWNITTFVQDWGSLIGLNVIGNHPERFARVAVGDGMLPVVPEGEVLFELPENPEQGANQFQLLLQMIPDQQPEFFDEDGELIGFMQGMSSADGSGYFGNWIYFSRDDEDFRASMVVEALTYFPLSDEEEAAYDAPFPARIAMGGPRSFPGLANTLGGATQSAWAGLLAFEKPFITIWASNDPGNLGSEELQQLLIDAIPGATGQAHTRLPQASHFLQDDQGDEIARRMIAFCEENPIEADETLELDTGTGDATLDTPALELSPNLCDDPANLELIKDSLMKGGGDGPSYGEVNLEQTMRMLQAPTAGPFYMVNLIEYREQAVYADGRETTLTGREADTLYAPSEYLAAVGARQVFMGEVTETTLGEEKWDRVAIVEYPCPIASFALAADPGFQARSVHKDAALESSIIMVTHVQPLDPVGALDVPYPATEDDPSFELVQVFRYQEEAQYAADLAEPSRSGFEAMEFYRSTVRDAEQLLGIYPKARLDVEGVQTGDGRDWDEVWIYHVPSQAAWDAFLADPVVAEAQIHREAALADAYELTVTPHVSIVPNIDGRREPSEPSDASAPAAAPEAQEDVRIGYEILQVVSPTEIITWLSTDLTQEEFDAITLPMGWFKNQPREGDSDSGLFASSPGAADGVFIYEEHFGHTWRHVATIVEANVPLDDKELLRANRISKTHALSFNAGRTLKVLIAPDGTQYVRVSRDAGRTSDVPTLPDGWSLIDYTTHEMLTIQLPDPTVNIRADNEDSFQGPVSLPIRGGEVDAGSEPGSTEPAEQLIEPATEIEGRVVEYYASPSSTERISRRGYRYCEILLGSLEQDELLAEVWGTQMVGPCLPEALESLDLEAVQAEYEAAFVVVNGPRLSTMDSGLFLIPEGPHRVYGELETQLIATIELDLAEVLANSGLSTALLHTVLETVDVATVLAGVDAYEESVVKRTTVFEYWAGSEVYELISPEGVVYVMQSVSNMLDPYLTLDDLPTLDTRLSLPDGWIYRTRTLETDLVLVIFGEAIVITDDIGNTYQRR